MNPFHGVAAVFRLQFHAYGAGAAGQGGDHGRTRADEGVEDDPAPRAAAVEARPMRPVARVLGEQEYVLKGPPGPVAGRGLRDGCGALPDNGTAQGPAVVLQSERDSPPYADERFPWQPQTRAVYGAQVLPHHLPAVVFVVPAVRAALRRVVGVAEIQEERPGGVERAP